MYLYVNALQAGGDAAGEVIRQYGLAGMVIVALAGTLVYLYKQWREESRETRREFLEALKEIEEARVSRDEKITSVLKEHTGAIRDMSGIIKRQDELQKILDRLPGSGGGGGSP